MQHQMKKADDDLPVVHFDTTSGLVEKKEEDHGKYLKIKMFREIVFVSFYRES